MNKKYDDEFFDELDKTTDLLKAFKPHITSNDSLNDLDDLSDLYSSFSNKTQKDNTIVQQRLENNKTENKILNNNTQLNLNSNNQLNLNSNTQNVTKKNNISSKQIEKIENLERQKEKINKKKKQEKTDINEIIDKINVSVEETKKKQKLAKAKTKEKEKKEKSKDDKSKFTPLELGFCAFSLLFLVGCCVIYGGRYVKAYKSDNNSKVEAGQSLKLLTTTITKNTSIETQNDGLYKSDNEYVYKGKDAQNYLRFSNFTWRILKVNSDGTIDIVLDDYINTLLWSVSKTSYLESDVHKYLNQYFINYLDKSYLTPTVICTDEVTDLKSFTCNNKNTDNYVRLLSVGDFVDSKTTSTYLADEKSTLWLNTVSTDKVWQVNGINLTLSIPGRSLGIKPVVRLKNGIALISGNGSKESPFMIAEESNKVMVGDYVKLKTDTYIVYDISDNKLSLVLDKVLPSKQKFGDNNAVFDPSNNTSIAYILNTSLYNSIAYKDILLDKQWNIGTYNTSYEDVTSSKVVAKIGLYDLRDLKFDNEVQNYYLMNLYRSRPHLYRSETILANSTSLQGIRPAIYIDNRAIISGNGTKEDPYVLLN